ncbi:tetratricopeptide repeat protein 29 isoform X2 [Cetorhinus maximus]
MSTIEKQCSAEPQPNLQEKLQNCDLPLNRQFQRPTSRVPTKKERSAEAKRLETWSKHLKLSKHDINIYRNSYKHNICLDMLQQGYHKSFSELTNLILNWNAVREAAGPGSDIWMEEPLDKQHDKLDHLQYFLVRAEAARRAGLFEEVYNNQLSLACYFKTVGDKLLSDHFFQSCLTTAEMIIPAGGQKVVEANANMGVAYEEKGGDKKMELAALYRVALGYLSAGDPDTAIGYLQMYLELSNSMDDDIGLGKTYEALAKALISTGHSSEALEYLKQFLTLAEKSDDKQSLVDACRFLGIMYNNLGQYDVARKYIWRGYEIAVTLGDLHLLEIMQVNFGIFKAHAMMTTYCHHVEAAGHGNLERLVTWKDSRKDTFEVPIMEDVATVKQVVIELTVEVEISNDENQP